MADNFEDDDVGPDEVDESEENAALEATRRANEERLAQLKAARAAQLAALQAQEEEEEARRLSFLTGTSSLVEALSALPDADSGAQPVQASIVSGALAQTQQAMNERLEEARRLAEQERLRLQRDSEAEAAARREAEAAEEAARQQAAAAEAVKTVDRTEQRAAEQRVQSMLMEFLGDSPTGMAEFKQVCLQFRHGRIDAKNFYVGIERLVGIDNSESLMPVLLEALPDAEKQAEFAKILKQAQKLRAARRAKADADAAAAREAQRIADEQAAAEQAARQAEEDAHRAEQEAAAAAVRAKKEAEAAEAAARLESMRLAAEAEHRARMEAAARADAEARAAAELVEAEKRKEQEAMVQAHIKALTEFYERHNPEKVGEVEDIWARLGVKVWRGLEIKYPGGTAEFTAHLPGMPAQVQPVQVKPAAPPVAPTPAPAPAPAPAPRAPAPIPEPVQHTPVKSPMSPSAPREQVIVDPDDPLSSFMSAPAPAPAATSPTAPRAPLGSDADHLDRLKRFYAAVNPSKLEEVPTFWAKRGRGLWQSLNKKYPGEVEPFLAGLPNIQELLGPVIDASAAPTAGGAEGSAIASPSPAAGAARDITSPTSVASGVPESPSMSTTTSESGGKGLDAAAVAAHKERLAAFYTKHNPGNVSKVDEIWSRHGPTVWAALERKYPGCTVEFTNGLHLESGSQEVVATIDCQDGRLEVTMWGCQEVLDDSGKLYAEYVLKCKWTKDSVVRCWMVPQRYSNFDYLHSLLRARYPTAKLPKLTGKTIFASSRSTKVKEKRQHELALYLAELFETVDGVIDSEAMAAFLYLDVQLAPRAHETANGAVMPILEGSLDDFLVACLPPLPPGEPQLASYDPQEFKDMAPLDELEMEDMESQLAELNRLLGSMRIDPRRDQSVQHLLGVIRNRTPAILLTASKIEGANVALVPRALQMEEDLRRVESNYASRLAILHAAYA